ncbi:glycosyltransferase [Caldifermentibacillus hisashii]|uniref:glycosyltransferase n=1 Tax=Caldifermentibacillus hisashii TaxID=996558 RepID=UPI001C118FCC|nr:glycosyltransferase [Caldifermentibacillus hisashii]MBU5343513.1 glycosyltransferase [Caldifermentibacillus hisashii]
MTHNFDILFLGGLFPKETEIDILNNSKGNIQNAANNLQWEIITGLDQNLDQPIQVLNSLYIGSFPKRYKKIYIRNYRFTHNTSNKNGDINVGFINLPGIKIFHRFIALKPYINRWAEKDNGRKKIVIAYAMTYTFTHLLRYVKKINKDIITCLIVPDLPQYMNLSVRVGLLYKYLKKVEINAITRDMNFIDCYVLLTKYMGEKLKIKVPYTIIEGIATDKFDEVSFSERESGHKTVLYTGTLEKKYGIIDLVESFKKLSGDNYRLIICGTGEAEQFVLDECKKDSRIVYKGLLKRDEVLKLQKSVTILINPRPNNEEYTKYSFPSKIMEYMSSGTPVLAYKLDGIPDEYYNYIYQIREEENGLYKSLREVLSKPDTELKEKGQHARSFVLEEKNNVKQTKKIINMLEVL